MPTCLDAVLPTISGWRHDSLPREVLWWVWKLLVRRTGNDNYSNSSGISEWQPAHVATLFCASMKNVKCISKVISCEVSDAYPG